MITREDLDFRLSCPQDAERDEEGREKRGGQRGRGSEGRRETERRGPCAGARSRWEGLEDSGGTSSLLQGEGSQGRGRESRWNQGATERRAGKEAWVEIASTPRAWPPEPGMC